MAQRLRDGLWILQIVSYLCVARAPTPSAMMETRSVFMLTPSCSARATSRVRKLLGTRATNRPDSPPMPGFGIGSSHSCATFNMLALPSNHQRLPLPALHRRPCSRANQGTWPASHRIPLRQGAEFPAGSISSRSFVASFAKFNQAEKLADKNGFDGSVCGNAELATVGMPNDVVVTTNPIRHHVQA